MPDTLIDLDAKTMIIGYTSCCFAFVFLYLKWFNIVQSNEADRLGIRNAGVYWTRIDTEDPRCPPFLRDAVRKTNRLGYLCLAAFTAVVALANWMLP
jgi:hypothetical protein